MQNIRSALKKLREERPGRRFRRTRKKAEGARKKLGRPLLLLLSVLLVAAGLFFMVVPGPGLLIFLAGLCLLSIASRRTAHLLDRSEIIIRKAVDGVARWWSGASCRTKALLIASTILVTVALGYALLRGFGFLQGG